MYEEDVQYRRRAVSAGESIILRALRTRRAACGAATATEKVRLGLEALVRHAAAERLRALLGSEPGAQDVPRRRERPRAKRKVA